MNKSRWQRSLLSFLLSIVLLLAAPTHAAIAQTQKRQQNILADPGLNVGQQIATNEPLNFLGKLGVDTHNVFARIRYGYNANNESVFESFPELSRYGPVYETSALALMPGQLQKDFSPPDEGGKVGAHPLKGMAGYRFCIPGGKVENTDRDNVPLTGVTATKDNIGTKEHPRFWAQLVWATQYLASILTRGKTTGVDFIASNGNMINFESTQESAERDSVFLRADPDLLDQILFPCGTQTTGTSMRRIEKEAEGEARTAGLGGEFFSPITARFQEVFFQGALVPCNEEDKEGHCAESRIYLLPTDSIAALPAVTSQTIGVSMDQLSSDMVASDRAKIVNDGGGDDEMKTPEGQKGGFVRSFLSSAFVKNIDYKNATTPQRQRLNFHNQSSENEPRNAYPLWMRSIADGFTCVENAYTPRQLQRSDFWCRYSQGDLGPYPGTAERSLAAWSGIPLNSDFSTSAWDSTIQEAIAQAATEGNVPACVLESVKYIETGTQSDFSGQCRINECSATGPFQITVGVVDDGRGGWTSYCGTCGGGKQCPDGWESVSRWPEDPSVVNPCDIPTAAKHAVTMLQAKAAYWTDYFFGNAQSLVPASNADELSAQQDAIIVSGNSYYGSGKAIDRLGECSYGEFVYKHCNASYSCTGEGKYLFPHEQQ